MRVKKKTKKNTGTVFSHLKGCRGGGAGGWGVGGGVSLLIVESSVPQCSEMANCKIPNGDYYLLSMTFITN